MEFYSFEKSPTVVGVDRETELVEERQPVHKLVGNISSDEVYGRSSRVLTITCESGITMVWAVTAIGATAIQFSAVTFPNVSIVGVGLHGEV